MTDTLTRSSVVAYELETTQNTIIAPTGATSFLPVLNGYTLTPQFDEITTEQLTGSIGESRASKGFENPTASLSLYVKHSGVEATAPNWGGLLKSAFGATTTAAAEYDTVSSSTTSLIKVNTGEGATYQRGEALLIKDSTNGYQVRNITSISSDDLTISPYLASAPASGVNLGRAILYYPADTSHPSLTLWDYRGNNGAVQVIGGARVTNFTMPVTAGSAIQGDFTIEGVEYYYDPMIVTANNKWFDFDEGGSEINVSVSTGTYKDPYKLAEQLQTAINDSTATGTYTVSYDDSTRKFTIVVTGVATFNILWKTGVHGSDNTDTHIGTLLGYVDTANDTGALTYTSDNGLSLAASYTPTFDSSDQLVAKDNQILLSTGTDTTCFRANTFTFTLTNEHSKIDDICATSGRSGSLISKRTATVEITSYLAQGQAEEFKNFRANTNVVFTFNCGQKTGTNWTPGTVVNVFIPTAVISSFEIADQNGLAVLNLSLKAYVSNGLGEVFMNFV